VFQQPAQVQHQLSISTMLDTVMQQGTTCMDKVAVGSGSEQCRQQVKTVFSLLQRQYGQWCAAGCLWHWCRSTLKQQLQNARLA